MNLTGQIERAVADILIVFVILRVNNGRLEDRFDVAAPLLPLQYGTKTCLFCDLVITSKEARNNISVSAMETLMKPHGIAEKWSKVKPVSSYAKNYEVVWDKIKI